MFGCSWLLLVVVALAIFWHTHTWSIILGNAVNAHIQFIISTETSLHIQVPVLCKWVNNLLVEIHSNLPKLIKLSLIAKFVVSHCECCKLRRNFGFFCSINHLRGPLRRHTLSCDWCISIHFVFVSVIALFRAIID